jgi:hypothetical protein
VEPERNEVYERIPWETLEEKKTERPWLMYGLAGALVLGSLAYSFMSNRPGPVDVPGTAGTSATVTVASPPPPPVAAMPPTSSVMAAEADLYAVHPERVIDRVVAHAEWFVAEYLTVDGSEQGRQTLEALLPAGVPLPVAPEGTRVFVEWVRALAVEESGPLQFRVDVLARSLAAGGDGAYQRQPPLQVSVEVRMENETPQVVMPPSIRPADVGDAHTLSLSEVPDEIANAAREQSGGTEILGGIDSGSGQWQVVVVAPAPDGVSRPVTVIVP